MARAKEFLHGMGIKVVSWSQCLGDFVINRPAKDSWLWDRVQGWIESVKNLSGVARKHPQSAYAGLQKSLQREWAFVQRFTPYIRDAFGPVEHALQEALIPALFKVLGEVTPWRGDTDLPVKQAGLALPDPTKTAPESWTASCVITGHLVAALRGQE